MKSIMKTAAFGIMALFVLGASNALAQAGPTPPPIGVYICGLSLCTGAEQAYARIRCHVYGADWLSAHWYSLSEVMDKWRGFKVYKDNGADGCYRDVVTQMEKLSDNPTSRFEKAERYLRRAKHDLASVLEEEVHRILRREICRKWYDYSKTFHGYEYASGQRSYAL